MRDCIRYSWSGHALIFSHNLKFATHVQNNEYPLAKLISKKRAPIAKDIYKEIGGSSPILKLTQDQAESLEKSLNSNEKAFNYKVFITMRCWHPRASDTVKMVKDFNPSEIVLLPLYPQYSAATSGSSILEWKERRAQKKEQF